jgi:cell division protein FtsZ
MLDMLEIPRTLLNDPGAAASPRILVAGIGNAGVSLIDRLTVAGFGSAIDLVAVNTDSVSLGASVASRKILIGSKTARGLGTGGDPEVGASSAEESEAELSQAFSGAHIVIVCAGLGGGAGSGAAPIAVELAKNQGALAVAVATLPFSFEGRRRGQQADDALAELGRAADALLTFENDRMAELSEPLAGVHETFSASDEVLAAAIAALARLTLTNGPIRVTPGDLVAMFRRSGTSSLFGFGEATGSNRANEAVERALKCQMLAKGRLLSDARATLVHITAPPDLRLVEIRAIMESVARHTDGHLHLGIGTDANFTALGVSILAATGGEQPAAAPRVARVSQPRVEPEPVRAESAVTSEPEPAEPVVAAKASELFDTSPYAVAKAGAKKAPKPEQKTLSLDPVARGRFEKSEPTIIGGEDLDVPTFLRQKIKLR